MRSCRPFLLATTLTLSLSTLPLACGTTERPTQSPVAAQLAPYDAQAATLFDDSIAPGVFGASIDGSDAASDPALPSWTDQAESVLPVRVSTVTSDSQGDSPIYTLVLQPAGRALAGRTWTSPISIEIDPTSPSYPFVHSADSTLVGKQFILFFRHYEQQGQTTLHWRAEADTPRLRAAVEQARLVGGFR